MSFQQVLNAAPGTLIAARGLLGLVVLVLAVFDLDHSGTISAGLVVAGLLTDIFDGMVARRLKVSTDALRVWDSRVDVAFFVFIVTGLLVRGGEIMAPVLWLFGVLAVLELSVHAISFIRFRRQSSTHHYLSKGFSIFLFGLIVQLYVWPQLTWFYWVTLTVGAVSFVEAGLIMLRLKEWACDIRTVFDVRDGIARR